MSSFAPHLSSPVSKRAATNSSMKYSFYKQEVFRQIVDVNLKLTAEIEKKECYNYTDAHLDIQRVISSAAEQPEPSQPPATLLSQIAKEITLSHELLGYPLEPYFSVAHILRDALLQKITSPDLTIENPSWLQATKYALEYFE